MSTETLSLCDFTPEQLGFWFQEQQLPRFHAKQILAWVYQKGVRDWQRMTNLSLELREKLSKNLGTPLLELVRIQPSADLETFKFLWRLSDQQLVESVLIMSGDRRTVCVSSQVGCPARCAFCASGQQGWMRNLSTGEIVEQVLHINHWLMEKNERVSHVVYMGMGEPMKNYDAVIKSVRILCHPDALGLSQRRVTISTVGVVEGIQQLTEEEGLRVNLVLSLHAPNQKLRQKIIPYARQYALDTILNAMDHYASVTKRDITYEYTLLAGINDHTEHAEELCELLQGRQCTVNLIPYNPVAGLRLQRPEKDAIHAFHDVLKRRRLPVTCRYTKGDDIAAACGQLALQNSTLEMQSPLRQVSGPCGQTEK